MVKFRFESLSTHSQQSELSIRSQEAYAEDSANIFVRTEALEDTLSLDPEVMYIARALIASEEHIGYIAASIPLSRLMDTINVNEFNSSQIAKQILCYYQGHLSTMFKN